MQFSENKFRALDSQAKAKKCADFLRRLLECPGPEWKARIRHYNELCRWQNRGDLCLSPDTLKASLILDAYRSWRDLTGLGPESAVLSLPMEFDRDQAKHQALPWRVWLHNIRSAQNAGSILRTADCLGWEGLYLSGYTPGAEHKGFKSAAMGAESWVDAARLEDPMSLFESGADPVYALELVPESVSIEQFQWPRRGVLLLGNEELGVSPAMVEKCAGVIQIPLFGRKGSLNVAQAFAIAAWELQRFEMKRGSI